LSIFELVQNDHVTIPLRSGWSHTLLSSTCQVINESHTQWFVWVVREYSSQVFVFEDIENNQKVSF